MLKTELKTDFVINPDEKPKFIGDNHLYDIFLRNLNGCDGLVDCLAIVELDGCISNVEFLYAVGKTNFACGLNVLNLLRPWVPAMKDGNAVRTQLRLKIYT
ncbi:MAG: hypothetical protein H6567_05085 [Lewinellaceae bacterium]|nr:hypothetical protein [Lewinellaceae bacterium]